ncbi:neuronal cell adhesion molecule isoform X2 [Gadus morhua]|uniref:neuronal cell adhesion molecule isoform X2 n=1 Tax=Gadus morhua TaxID=8049 RepID=UPI0011B81920|nr:neuronal cell adhesion molecule-like isoform X2 [Gadus morhua]
MLQYVLIWCFLVLMTAQSDAPEFLLTPLIRNVTEGDNVTLECPARGNPAPAISWHTNNDTLSTTENQTTLLIIGVSQSKNYSCTATNRNGTILQTFNVNVKKKSATFTNQSKTACPLEFIPKRVVEKYGASLSVICRPTTTSAEPDIIGWEAPIGKWNLNMPDNKSATWNVEKFEDWTFEPFCFGTFSDQQCSVTLPITLYKTPDTVSISVQNHSGPLQEGRRYTLQCDVFDVAPLAALTVSWLWKGEIIQTHTYDDHLTKTPENVSSTWEITAFRNYSNDMITCLTILDLKQDGPSQQVNASTAFQVIVHYAPEFLLTPLIRNVTEGDNVTLECPARGNPAPAISWHTNNDTLSTTENQTTLLIIGVSQSKNYSCTATNRNGTILQTFNVNVKKTSTSTTTTATFMNQPTACPLEFIPKRVVERHGASVSVICRPTTTSAEPDIIGWEAPIGLWNLNMPDNKSATWNVEKFEDWTFEPVCFGTFSDQQCSVTLPITLYKTPDTVSISVQNHSGPLQEGRRYTLQCDVFNVAPLAALTVSWLWKGEIIQTHTYDDHLTKTPENVSSTWEITAFRNYSNEVITCLTILDPKQGGPSQQVNTSAVFKVIVHYAPKFTDEYDSVEVVTGGNVSFGCSAEGNPPPEVKCNYPVAINARATTRGRQHTVSITRATSANGGIYNCVATNEVGTATWQTTLTITPLDHTTGVNYYLILVVILVIIIIMILCYYFCTKKHGRYSLISARNNDVPLHNL